MTEWSKEILIRDRLCFSFNCEKNVVVFVFLMNAMESTHKKKIMNIRGENKYVCTVNRFSIHSLNNLMKIL